MGQERYTYQRENKVTRIIIPKPNNDQYAADKYLYKDFVRNQRILQQQQKELYSIRNSLIN